MSKRIVPVGLLLVLLTAPVFSLEIGAAFTLGTLSFRHDRAQTTTSFSGTDLMWGVSASVEQRFSDAFTFSSGFHRDQILRNVSYTIIQFTQSFLRIGVGPFFGFFNAAATILKPGISTSVQLEFPGVAYVAFRADSSIGGRLVEVGDYTQERSDIRVGVYLRNAICTAQLQTRKFSQKTAADVETVDGMTSYAFITDIFQKNVPYRVVLSFGYQNLTRSFISSTATVRHALNSIVLGTEVDLDVTEFLTTTLNLDSSIYTFGSEALLGISNPGPGGYLFRATVGMVLDTDRIPTRD